MHHFKGLSSLICQVSFGELEPLRKQLFYFKEHNKSVHLVCSYPFTLEKEMATHCCILHGPWGRRKSDITEVTKHVPLHSDLFLSRLQNK